MAQKLEIPKWVEEIFEKYLTAEFTYIDGETPRTVAVLPYYDPEKRSIIVTTSPAFYKKVECVKRNPKVSILFSNPKFSGVERYAVVLVQGSAEVDEDIVKNIGYMYQLMINQKDCWKKTVLLKMAEELTSPIFERLMDWYLLRIIIEIKPERILIWPDGNLDKSPEMLG
ncbi:MAG: pyridoxamine 5'-phosphate oxidase family protein [Archaeoglobaceae archaeon]|nr:pyridoxamine 5'-phosphate oxidase family protein [Archaeoglobaceae archaeon]